MLFNRWVSYIFEYIGNQKKENIGFVKVQCTDNCGNKNARIQVGVKLIKQKSCKLSVYLLTEDQLAYKIDKIDINPKEADMIIKKMELDYENPIEQGIRLCDYVGMAFLGDDKSTYVTMWKDMKMNMLNINPIDSYNARFEEAKTIENSSYEIEDLDEIADLKEDKCDMLNLFCDNDKLDVAENCNIERAVKIGLNDIGKLPVRNWGYARNSFLLHGLSQSNYLMVGRKKNDKRWVIGVPSRYTNKSRYIARAYGFTEFIADGEFKLNTGQQGYFVSYISIE